MSEPYYGWAVDAVEGLRWLRYVDEWAFERFPEQLEGRDPRVIDLAHVRWATVTAVTAIDLCVAEIAVQYGGFDFWSECLPSLERLTKKLAGKTVPPAATDWLDRVADDSGYQTLRAARNPLTHRFLVRTALMGPGRTPFEVDRNLAPEDRPDARDLILLSLDVATRHVREFGTSVGRRPGPPPPRPR
jgi:hypothetical protein